MTPKEKAEEIRGNFERIIGYSHPSCHQRHKEASLLYLNGIINCLKTPQTQKNAVLVLQSELKFWESVKSILSII